MQRSGSSTASPSSSMTSSKPRTSRSVTPLIWNRIQTPQAPMAGSLRSAALSTPVSRQPCRSTLPRKPELHRPLPNTWTFTTSNVSSRTRLETIPNSQAVVEADAVGIPEHHFSQCSAWEQRLRHMGWRASATAAKSTGQGGTLGGLFHMVQQRHVLSLLVDQPPVLEEARVAVRHMSGVVPGGILWAVVFMHDSQRLSPSN
eukprot:4704676-Pyramimonas_sp.AAC.1